MIFRKKGDNFVANGSTDQVVQDYVDVLYKEKIDEEGLALQTLKSSVKHQLRQQHMVSPIRILKIDVDERGMVTVKTHPKRR